MPVFRSQSGPQARRLVRFLGFAIVWRVHGPLLQDLALRDRLCQVQSAGIRGVAEPAHGRGDLSMFQFKNITSTTGRTRWTGCATCASSATSCCTDPDMVRLMMARRRPADAHAVAISCCGAGGALGATLPGCPAESRCTCCSWAWARRCSRVAIGCSGACSSAQTQCSSNTLLLLNQVLCSAVLRHYIPHTCTWRCCPPYMEGCRRTSSVSFPSR